MKGTVRTNSEGENATKLLSSAFAHNVLVIFGRNCGPILGLAYSRLLRAQSAVEIPNLGTLPKGTR